MDRQLLLDQTPAQISLGIHNVSKFLQILFGGSTDDGVAILRPGLHFANCRRQTGFDLLGRFSAAFGQTPAQFVNVRRHNENIRERVPDKFVLGTANTGGALCIDVDQDIAAALQIFDNWF